MNKGGIARRLIDFARAIVGMLPGGLAYVNILACMLFGAISGSAVAAASAIGGFMHPEMEKEGYSKPFSAAVNITSSTTGLLIPPSNILIVYSLASGGASIAALFLAGYIPGILVGLALIMIAGIYAYRHKYTRGRRLPFRQSLIVFFRAIPSLSLIIVVIGGIVAGFFTPTEASAISVIYAGALAFIYREMNWKELPDIFLKSIITTSIVMLLIGASMGLSWTMSFENIPQDVTAALLSFSSNKIVILLIINFILLVVGVFMDMTPAVLIFTPIFLPVVTSLGMNPVHFGIIMVFNLCIGICTPPVGSVLFVGCSVAGISLDKVLKPLMPMFIAMIVVLLIVSYIPALSLWLPGLFGY
jgi:tripartite ATP-independent transporter DctM subunit